MCSQFMLVFAAAAVAMAVCLTNDEELYKNHRAANGRMPCAVPQPRVVSWQEIFKEEKDKPDPCEIMRPHVSVLHRCDFGSGCCDGDSKLCQVEQKEDVTLVYQLLWIKKKLIGGQCADHTGNTTRYIHIKALNHTRCACMGKENLPK